MHSMDDDDDEDDDDKQELMRCLLKCAFCSTTAQKKVHVQTLYAQI